MIGPASNVSTFLGCDISRVKDPVQFGILFGSLLFFMCLYGLFQEIVIYDWFERKLSVFTAALHFLGCAVCAIFLHLITAPSVREGMASLFHAPKAPMMSYVGLCSLKACHGFILRCNSLTSLLLFSIFPAGRHPALH